MWPLATGESGFVFKIKQLVAEKVDSPAITKRPCIDEFNFRKLLLCTADSYGNIAVTVGVSMFPHG